MRVVVRLRINDGLREDFFGTCAEGIDIPTNGFDTGTGASFCSLPTGLLLNLRGT